MKIATIAKFLFGQRQAILDIAASRQAIWLGLLFVLSAGFAREYDGEDLLHEPLHLLIPLAASLVTSTILYGLLWIVFRGWRTFPNEWPTYRAFVTLYWMTAPLAWIYAVPVERFGSAEQAAGTNFVFLGFVAFWRVLLIIRVIVVLFRVPALHAIFCVLFFSDTVLLTLMRITPRPITEIMGGVRLTQAESMIAGVSFLITGIGVLVWPFFALGAMITIFSQTPRDRLPSLNDLPDLPVRRSLWGCAIASLLVWLFVLPITQPEQIRRWNVEYLMRRKMTAAALEYMSRFEPSDFPPHWDPPPRIAYQERPASELLDVLDEFDRMQDAPAWMTREYHRKFEYHLEDYREYWEELSDEDFDRVLNWMEKIPLSDLTLGIQRDRMRVPLDPQWSSLKNRTPEQRERLRKALQIETAVPQPSPASETVPKGEPTPPKPDDLPQTPPVAESKDDGSGVDKPADKAADR